MKSFAETLKLAESSESEGIPMMSDSFARWGQDIRQDAESLWPAVAERVLQEHATKIFVDIDCASPIQ